MTWKFELNEDLHREMLAEAASKRKLAFAQAEMIINLFYSFKRDNPIDALDATLKTLQASCKAGPHLLAAASALIVTLLDPTPRHTGFLNRYWTENLLEHLVQHNDHMVELPDDEEFSTSD